MSATTRKTICLFSICLMYSFQHRFLSGNTTPRNIKHSNRSISLLRTLNFGKRTGISLSFVRFMEK